MFSRFSLVAVPRRVAFSAAAARRITTAVAATPIASRALVSRIRMPAALLRARAFSTDTTPIIPAGSEFAAGPTARESSDVSADSIIAMARAVEADNAKSNSAAAAPADAPAAAATATPAKVRKPRATKPKAESTAKAPKAKKRPPSAYALYVKETSPVVRAATPGQSIGVYGKQMAAMWAALQPEQRAVFNERAKKLKEEFVPSPDAAPVKRKKRVTKAAAAAADAAATATAPIVPLKVRKPRKPVAAADTSGPMGVAPNDPDWSKALTQSYIADAAKPKKKARAVAGAGRKKKTPAAAAATAAAPSDTTPAAAVPVPSAEPMSDAPADAAAAPAAAAAVSPTALPVVDATPEAAAVVTPPAAAPAPAEATVVSVTPPAVLIAHAPALAPLQVLPGGQSGTLPLPVTAATPSPGARVTPPASPAKSATLPLPVTAASSEVNVLAPLASSAPVTPTATATPMSAAGAPPTPTPTPASTAGLRTPPTSNRGLGHIPTRERSDSERPHPAVLINHNSYSAYPPHQIRWVTDLASGSLVPVLDVQKDTRIAGTLSIRVRRARNLYKATVMGAQDPFCELVIGPNKLRTPTHKKGGTEPLWEYNCNVKLKGSETQLTCHVHHDGSIKNEKIGSFKVQLRSLLQLTNPASVIGTSELHRSDAAPAMAGGNRNQKDAESENYVESWFALGRDNSKIHCGEIQLRLQFTPDLDAPLISEVNSSGGAPAAPSAPSAPAAPKVHMSAAQLAALATGLPGGGGGGDQKAGLLTEIRGGKKLRKASNAGFFSLRKKGDKKVLFGGTLKEGLQNSTFRVPDLVFHCVEYLRKNGLETVGLFRVPGSNEVVNRLKAQFDKFEIPDLVDVNSTATLLKLYLRELKESLIPSTHYGAYLELEDAKTVPGVDAAADEKKIGKYQVIEASIPRENRDLLHYLTAFLYAVSEKSAVNKMDVANLAIVFAPSVIRAPPTATAATLINDTPRITNVMRSLIQFHARIFVHAPEADLLSK